MKRFKAKVRAGGTVNDAVIEARNITAATRMLEAQFGKGNVFAVRHLRE